MIIRTFQHSDLEACRNLWADLTQFHRDMYDNQTIGGEDPGGQFDEHLECVGPERIWLGVLKGEIVGMIGLIQEGKEGEVEPVIVAADYRDSGVGKQLLDHVFSYAAEQGIKRLKVRPVARNEAGLSFFHHFGFETLGRLELMKWITPPKSKWPPGPKLAGRRFKH